MPYLWQEAQAHGWPLVRSMWLHHYDDETSQDLDAQFLLGEDVLVAPVLLPNTSSVRLSRPTAGTRE